MNYATKPENGFGPRHWNTSYRHSDGSFYKNEPNSEGFGFGPTQQREGNFFSGTETNFVVPTIKNSLRPRFIKPGQSDGNLYQASSYGLRFLKFCMKFPLSTQSISRIKIKVRQRITTPKRALMLSKSMNRASTKNHFMNSKFFPCVDLIPHRFPRDHHDPTFQRTFGAAKNGKGKFDNETAGLFSNFNNTN
jgi:hypothetical protein